MTLPDPPSGDPRLHLAHEWLRHATTDLAAAAALRGDEQFAFVIAFHAQQAAEKSLKAFLAWKDVPFRRTHNLEELLDECASIEPSFDRLRDDVVDLTPYAVDTRYPGDDPTLDEAREAHRCAGTVATFVRALVPHRATGG